MSQPLKIFIIYARKDAEFKDELIYHLKPLQMLGLVDTWHDGDLQPGAVWDMEIKNQLHRADVVIPLISTHFINSDYIQGTEFKEARRRWECGEAEITPVVVRDCLWEELASLADLQALPSNGQKILPVTRWPDRDEAWTVIANGLKGLCVEVRARRQQAETAQQEKERREKEMTEVQRRREEEQLRLAEQQKQEALAREKIAEEEHRRREEIERQKIERREREPSFWGKYRYGVLGGAGVLILLLAILLNRKDETPSPNTLEKQSAAQIIEPEMVFVESGIFTMGCTAEQGSDCEENEKPAHKVMLNSFYIGRYEVTQAQWKSVMRTNPSYFKDCDECPVESVSWDDIQEFLQNLNEKSGKKYRLPTEAEWEYAARGGNKSQNFKYSGSDFLNEAAWYKHNADDKTHPVGRKKANELGLYDMSGNVWEWCEDVWHVNYVGAPTDGVTWKTVVGGEQGIHVVRGGSFDYNPYNCRVAQRYKGIYNLQLRNQGFRLAQ